MSWIELILFAVVQGVTEFLPISSSTHLQFLNELLAKWRGHFPLTSDQMLLLFLFLHLGTLLALVQFLFKTITRSVYKVAQDIRHRRSPRLLWVLAAAMMPMFILGVPLKLVVDQLNLGFLPQGIALIVFGWFLYWTDRRSGKPGIPRKMPLAHACLIGIGQAIALFPGASRLGMTIAMARFLGYDRTFSVYFSFYLAIPTMIVGMGYEFYDLWHRHQIQTDFLYECIIAGGVTFAVSLMVIRLLIHWVQKHSFFPLVVYRMVFGTCLIGWFLVFTY